MWYLTARFQLLKCVIIKYHLHNIYSKCSNLTFDFEFYCNLKKKNSKDVLKFILSYIYGVFHDRNQVTFIMVKIKVIHIYRVIFFFLKGKIGIFSRIPFSW